MGFLHRVRAGVNYLNLSTPLGLLLAKANGARIGRAAGGLFVAYGYRLRVPPAATSAFTLGNVVLVRDVDNEIGTALLRHEGRHATQYAFCIGPVMLPFYLLAAVVSYALCRDFGSWNLFERLAGLEDGNYERKPLWWRRPPQEQV